MALRTAAGSRRGILNPRAGDENFVLARHEPSPALAPFVERYWSVRWDLSDRPPFAQETLPYPCVNVVVGTHRPGVFGPTGRRFVAMLEGQGWVVGAKFRPGGFRPFHDAPISELADRSVSIAEAFGADGARFEHDVHAATSDAERIARFDTFLEARLPPFDPEVERAARIVAIAETDPRVQTVADLAERGELSVRALQRLFGSYVGVSPKWVLRRFRIHEAAERVASGPSADLASLAHDLGYFDQSHFIRDFKAQVGRTPAAYAAWCRGEAHPASTPGPAGEDA